MQKQKSRKKPFELQLQESYKRSIKDYCQLRQELESQRILDKLFFDGTPRYRSIHSNHILHKVYYLDFYSLPSYGKTKLGWYVQKAKVGDKLSIRFVDAIAERLKKPLDILIKQKAVDALLWVPHSLSRQVSLMDELKKNLASYLPQISVMKAFQAEVIPQKSISDLQARIKNALSSNHILTNKKQLSAFKHILIIDDAIGSNATIQSIATRLKQSVPEITISAISVVGSLEGFDVIQDI